MAIGLLAIFFLVAANAAFVAAEFGLITVEKTTLRSMSEAGDRRAGRILQSVRRLSFHLSGAQLGITWSSLAVGAIIEPTVGVPLSILMERLPFVPRASALEISVSVALILATAVQMVIGELIPKNVAIAVPMRTAMIFNPPLRLHNSLLSPLISFLNGSANAFLRLIGIEPREELAGIRSLRELDLFIESSFQEKAVDEESFRLLRRSITFASKTVRNVMVPRVNVIGVDEGSTLQELAKLHAETSHSRFPVYTRTLDEASHVVHVKDVLSVPPSRRGSEKVSAIMKDALVVPESVRLRPLLAQMRSRGSHMTLVTDEYGTFAGIVTLDDILEEIVGELSEDPGQIRIGPKGIIVPGDLSIGELEETTGLGLPEGEYETLAGFLMASLGALPEPGETVRHDGWVLEVVETQRLRIEKIRVIAPGKRSRWRF
ncbi:MAG: hemolysin family protein [Actinobacteria bacterium]|nr:hemolysin family protein [Actinomycetota bacterium]